MRRLIRPALRLELSMLSVLANVLVDEIRTITLLFETDNRLTHLTVETEVHWAHRIKCGVGRHGDSWSGGMF
jgi:hypothetical protein